ncbi:MAG: hypothetical protein ACLRSU_12720, partial [Thomasclavelia spiroformis]
VSHKSCGFAIRVNIKRLQKIFCRSASVRCLKEIHESDCYWGILYGYGKNHLGIILMDIEKTL